MLTYFYFLLVYFSRLPLIPLVSLLSFKLNFICFILCPPPHFRYPLYRFSFIFPSFSLNYFSLHLFFSLHIFTVSFFFFSIFFSFIFHLTFVYLSLFPLFPNLFSSFSPYIFLLCRYSSRFTFSHSRPSCFIPSLHKSPTHDKSEYVFFSHSKSTLMQTKH